jgi:hypothetical protein
MSTSSPTQITVFLNPEDEEHALYLIGESFTSTTFTFIDTQEEQVTWGTIFVFTHKEKASPWRSLRQRHLDRSRISPIWSRSG